MMELLYYYAELKNRRVGYTNKTQFLVQIGWGNSGYRTKHTITGDLRKAFDKYDAIIPVNTLKKRLLMVGAKKPIIAKQFGNTQ